MTLDRRSLLVASGGAALIPAASAKADTPPPSPRRLFDVLQAILAAWRTQDVEGVLAHVTDDIVWQNSAGYAPAIRGKAQMRAALQTMGPVIATSKWRIFDYAESQDRLFMEGVDEFILKSGARVAIPYAGVLEFRGLLIHEWREYFDGRLSSQMKTGEPVPPSVEAMIGRPVLK